MYRAFISRAAMTVILVFTVMAVFPVPSQAALQPIVYTIRIPSPESHIAEIEVTIPTEKQPSVELMMAVWSPGFYRVEDYAAKVQKLSARTSAGVELKFVSHEYFHAINVKRLRPIELGPFDYENPPKTPSLWISEGLTSYYGNLAVVRSGVGSADDFLHDLSGQIRQLQNSPGRLVQTLEQSSLDVWTDSYSGIGGITRRRSVTT
jgi:predicted metalloprotease with PDZ domain